MKIKVDVTIKDETLTSIKLDLKFDNDDKLRDYDFVSQWRLKTRFEIVQELNKNGIHSFSGEFLDLLLCSYDKQVEREIMKRNLEKW